MPIGDCMTPPPNFEPSNLMAADQLVERGIPRDVAERVVKRTNDLYQQTFGIFGQLFEDLEDATMARRNEEMLSVSLCMIAMFEPIAGMQSWSKFAGSLLMAMLKEDNKPTHQV